MAVREVAVIALVRAIGAAAQAQPPAQAPAQAPKEQPAAPGPDAAQPAPEPAPAEPAPAQSPEPAPSEDAPGEVPAEPEPAPPAATAEPSPVQPPPAPEASTPAPAVVQPPPEPAFEPVPAPAPAPSDPPVHLGAGVDVGVLNLPNLGVAATLYAQLAPRDFWPIELSASYFFDNHQELSIGELDLVAHPQLIAPFPRDGARAVFRIVQLSAALCPYQRALDAGRLAGHCRCCRWRGPARRARR
jgi:hypothetical protein